MFSTVPHQAYANPAYPSLLTAEQPDGSTANYYLPRDEYFSYKTAPDGSRLQTDPDIGALRVVIQSADGSLTFGQ